MRDFLINVNKQRCLLKKNKLYIGLNTSSEAFNKVFQTRLGVKFVVMKQKATVIRFFVQCKMFFRPTWN